MKKFLLFCLLLPLSVFSQALSGSYTIGTGQPFPFNTLTNAVNRINTSGVTGPVIFLLDNTTYNNISGESFPIRITNFSGSSAVNTLTIRPNINRTVTIAASPGPLNYIGVPAAIQLDGADNVIINGSNTAIGSTQNLTINNSDNISYLARTAIWISSNATNGANNISILNTIISMANRNQDALLFAGIYSGSNSLASNNGINVSPATAANSQLTVRNNAFNNVRQGVHIEGNINTSIQTTAIHIVSNVFGSLINAEKPVRPIYLTNVNNFNIEENTVNGVLNAGYSGLAINAIEIANGSNFTIKKNILSNIILDNNSTPGHAMWMRGEIMNGVVSENSITNVKNTGGGIMRGISLDLEAGISSNLTLANNFISDVTSTGTTTNTGYGIYIGSGRNIKLYHNSVAMNTAQPGTSAALFVNSGTELDVRNNIFQNGSTGNRYAVYSMANASAFTSINHNNYFSSPIGFLGSDRATIENWRAATGKDVNSVSISPVFTSASDLHLPTGTNAALDNLGTPIASVLTDIDGTTRSLSTPDIGADEFSSQVLAAEPTVQASAITFSNVTQNSFTVNWASGNGARRLVVIRSGTAVNANPVDAAVYSASGAFGSGSQIGTGNYVIHANTGNSVNVTNLNGNTTYHVAVYEYNGTGGAENYMLNPARGNRLTLNPTLGWQIAAVNTPQTISFDATVSNVNQGAFTGAGFRTAPAAGQLNSNAWSVTGLSDGIVNFGSDVSDGSSASGVSPGAVNAAGIYAFQVADNNHALGFQPGTNDLVPGTVVLRTQNQTGVPITSLSIGYKVFIYNDQDGTGSFNFSHSANNSTFTAIPAIDVVSPASADGAPTWKASYRVVTITGLNIAANSYYYLRWSANNVSGSTYDEFALDDVVLSANPVGNFATFSGTANDFIVNGNATLNGATTVGNLTLNSGKLSVNGQTLTLSGSVINSVSGGLRGGASSNLILTGSTSRTLSFDQTTLGTTNLWNNFSVPFGTEKTITIQNPVVINGSLNVSLDQTLDFGTNAVAGALSAITINGSLMTKNTSALPIPAGKVWGGAGTVVYNAPSAQQRIVTGTYNGLSVTTPGGGLATGNLNVNGLLALPISNPSATIGALDMGSHTLLMGPNAINTGAGDVSGIVSRDVFLPNVIYTFGHPHTSITFPNVGTLPSAMSLKISLGVAPAWKPTAIKRMYDLIQTGAIGTKAVIKSHYLDSELNNNSENRLVDWSYIVGPPPVLLEQGRSNFNAVNNYVELTNVNIGLYFQSTFGKVLLSMANSEADVLTWTGQSSNSWTTAANWSPNATPSDSTAVIIPDAAFTPNDPQFNPLVPVKSINIQSGGIVYAPAQSVATITGAGAAWINNGQYIAASGSEVIFVNPDATISGTTNFDKLTIAGTANLLPTTGSKMRIANTLLVSGTLSASVFENTIEFTGTNQIIPVTNTSINTYYNITVSGSGTIFPASLNIAGNLILNQPVDFTGKTISMNGLNPQIIGGSSAANFDNLIINQSTGDVSLHTNTSVLGTLTLSAGNLFLGNNNLILNASAVSGTFSTTNMIVVNGNGQLRRTFSGPGTYFFPIGEDTGNNTYSPISVTITEGTFTNAFVGVRVIDAVHPANSSTNNNLSRYWELTQSGISGAIANVSGTYFLPDVTGTQASVSSAVLTGAFDQQTNPWIKYQPLDNLTLEVTGTPLPAGQTTAITGIKGAMFSATVQGHGSFCENEDEMLTAVPVNGDAPFSYQWSDSLGTNATAIPSGNIGSFDYTVTVKDANGQSAQAVATVVTVAEAIPGSLSATQEVCFGYAPDEITISGNSAPVQYWQRAENANFNNAIDINIGSNILTAANAGFVVMDTYFRAAVGNGTCPVRYTEPVMITVRSTTWDGSTWNNGVPTATVSAVIAGPYNQSADINACSLTITNNAIVVIPEGFDVKLTGSIIVNSGSFTIENNSNLVQYKNETNYGQISVKRNSSPLFRLDYTMWGSPVTGNQTLLGFSPLTATNRFYTMNNGSGAFSTVNTQNQFSPGTGYLIRMPNNHISYTASAVAEPWMGTFVGTPVNGPVSVPLFTMGDRYNMVANPYPSVISADELLYQNEANVSGTIYFWRRRNNVPTGTEDTNAYYATYTSVGGTAVSASGSLTSEVPNGFIQVGQGFIVQSLQNPATGAIGFDNSMRTDQSSTQFFKSASVSSRSRAWINITGPQQMFSQTLLAYTGDADMGIDRADGKYMNDGSFAFTSLIGEAPYIIQARPFEMLAYDIVPMHFRTPVAGTFSISLDAVDGVFANGQNVFLRDYVTGTVHNLSDGDYNFTTTAVSVNSRFEILFEQPLGTNDPVAGNDIIVFKRNNSIVAASATQVIDEVFVYDIGGRLLFSKKDVDALETAFSVTNANQMLIIRIKVGDYWVTKKFLN